MEDDQNEYEDCESIPSEGIIRSSNNIISDSNNNKGTNYLSALQTQTSLNDKNEDVYVFIKFLGKGSFGSVNLYRHSKGNRLVVWKEIDLSRLNAKEKEEAYSEIEILKMLDHPNIITYYKHFTGDNELYIELEYANGATLAHLIREQIGKNFDENIVLWYLYQILSAVDYIHDFHILHRDIKSLNIFSMKSGLLKLGDFGISKQVDPEIGLAATYVGTPYYMSPELVSGQKYNTKSDIWSVGCVLYEILCLKKVFEASNHLRLAMKIVYCDVNEIPIDKYSVELRELAKQLLSKDPNNRLSAKEALNNKLIQSKAQEYDKKIETLNSAKRKFQSTSSFNEVDSIHNTSSMSPIVASKLSELYIWGGGKVLPQKIEQFKKETAPLYVSVGMSHYAVITVEKELYTWAASSAASTRASNHAKLGHGKEAGLSRIPRKVQSLNGIFIKQVSCGEDFTCCLSESGVLYTFGTDYCGCLGLGNDDTEASENDEDEFDPSQSVFKAIPVPYFSKKSIKIDQVSCGDSHVVVLTQDNEVYTWGCGEFGRCGHGDEDDVLAPKKLNLPTKYKIQSLVAGNDCTFLITKRGSVLAFGNNENNKLCLNYEVTGLKNLNARNLNSDVGCQLVPKLIKDLSNYEIIKVASGNNHTAAIDRYGRLFTFGSNKYGQLGVGDSKARKYLNLVGGPLVGHNVINVSCGDTFTICATSYNHVFSFGNCKDGRLGIHVALNDLNLISSPRPIFGSLHLVSDMCSKHWNSIIVAEQIINAKTVRSVSYNGNRSNHTITYQECNNEQIDSGYGTCQIEEENEGFNKIENALTQEIDKKKVDFSKLEAKFNESKTNQSTFVPDWLKQDLLEAEYIPMDQSKSFKSDETPTPSTGSSVKNAFKTETEIKTLEEALLAIEQLKLENKQLKKENEKLKKENESLRESSKN